MNGGEKGDVVMTGGVKKNHFLYAALEAAIPGVDFSEMKGVKGAEKGEVFI